MYQQIAIKKRFLPVVLFGLLLVMVLPSVAIAQDSGETGGPIEDLDEDDSDAEQLDGDGDPISDPTVEVPDDLSQAGAAIDDVDDTDDPMQAAIPPVGMSTCSGEIAIVVASDVAAQSDIYSAVTLAGVVGTDCIVLAGARNGTMSADQRARLDDALSSGWIVGGTAAVPPSKTAGWSMKRIAGVDRWHTARLVGAVAANPDADIARLHAAIVAWNPLANETDCSGSVAIVVASDVAALSDIYSAVTLAGVLGTDCIVFAGSRGAAMPGDQRDRLDSARSGGWIVGGSAAVPASKIAGRSMKRIAGADRWHTARLVGAIAADPDVDIDSLVP
ncbi:hypothetical protein [Candidatus Poriferisodalis sp.]|uniref:hypothetical protein n=1 Tax=Candidatus Poriferisodalis sp. TaxID=3101277 RepID=UPI003D0CA7AD